MAANTRPTAEAQTPFNIAFTSPFFRYTVQNGIIAEISIIPGIKIPKLPTSPPSQRSSGLFLIAKAPQNTPILKFGPIKN